MRVSILARCVTLFVVAGSSLVLHAQFQEPTKEELQMTADPKAPVAAAVYFNIEEITDDPLHYRSFYARIKVLQEKGKELATVELPYQRGDFNISDIHGRTIHPDGTVIPLTGKPEALLISKGPDKEYGRRVFTLPSVEVGSIIEYRYELRYDDNHYSSPLWEMQRRYFAHKEHFAFTPFKAFLRGAQNATSQYLVDAKGNKVNSLIWWPLLPPGVKLLTDATGRFSVDLADVPPIPDEDWMPPINSLLYHVLFYYMSAHDSGDFWVSEAKRWSKEVDHFAQPTAPIRAAVNGIIAPSDSETDKAKKLYKAGEALENIDYSRKKGKSELKQLGLRVAKRAEDTWAQKSGTSQDITLLYLAMLRAAGFTAYDMRVVNRDSSLFAPAYLNFDQLDDDIVIAVIGGKEIFLDPGEKVCPFGLSHWRHSGTGGIRESADGRAAATSPLLPYTANTLSRIGDISLDEHGAVKGDFRFIMAGQEAIYWRQQSLFSDDDEVKKKFDRSLGEILPDGVEGHIDHFLGMDDPDVNLIAMVKVQCVLGSATSKRLLLPGYFFESRGHRPFVDEAQRLELIDMHYADRVIDQVIYHLPAGLTVEGAPQDAKIPYADQAVLTTKTVSAPDQITIARSLARGFTFVKAEKFQDLRDFYQKVAANDQQQLVLASATPQKGN